MLQTKSKLQENWSVGSEVFSCGWTDGQTDIRNIIVAFVVILRIQKLQKLRNKNYYSKWRKQLHIF